MGACWLILLNQLAEADLQDNIKGMLLSCQLFLCWSHGFSNAKVDPLVLINYLVM